MPRPSHGGTVDRGVKNVDDAAGAVGARGFVERIPVTAVNVRVVPPVVGDHLPEFGAFSYNAHRC